MKTTSHYYIGIDMHKRFSQVHVLDQGGQTAWKGRIEGNDPAGFESLVRSLEGPCEAVFEAQMNWHVLYDGLVAIEGIEEVVMAHPLKVRVIWEAQVKNDKVDAMQLARLLRLGMVPRAHAASAESRHVKELVRQRAAWVGMRTRIRNRTHRLLGAVPGGVALPQCSDLFGAKGLKALREAELPAPHDEHRDQNLGTLEEIDARIRECEKRLTEVCATHEEIALLQSVPGIGKVLACVLGSEIDGIGRFPDKRRFIGYCGLAPTTRGSAGAVWQGRMMVQCNRWLKWAFIEAAWVAVGCDSYFGSYYKSHRARGKKANTSITIVARRMARIVHEILSQQRPYRAPSPNPKKNFPARSSSGLVGEAV